MMKLVSIALLAAGTAACTAEEPVARADAAASLAAELRDYEPDGAPVSCVSMRELRGNRSAGDAIIFDGSGNRLWVNRPPGGCPSLDFGRALQTRTTMSQLCRGDIATVIDPGTGMTHGGCGLGDFTPYRRRSG